MSATLSIVGIVAGDRVYPATRALAGSIVPFLLLGIYVLYVRTDHTRQLWAWEIRSPMSALMLASAYAAGAYYFSRAVFARHWHHIGRGLLPVLAFAALMCAVTIVHWPLFLHDNIAFTLWAALYFTTPVLVAAAWWVNRREDTGRPDEHDVAVPDRVRRISRGIGLVSAATAVLPPFTATLALELAPVRVNLIAAGFVDTPLSASLLGDGLEARREQLRTTLPIGRVVGPADVAALAVHLMSNTALTGATYDIDGGQQLV